MRCGACGLPLQEGEGTIDVTPPPHRFDLQIEEDLIEEVARLIGYDNLPTTPPLAPITARVRPEARRSRFAVRHRLAALGYQETINFSFVEARLGARPRRQRRPDQAAEPDRQPDERDALVAARLAAAGAASSTSTARRRRVRVFELGRVFLRDAERRHHRHHRARASTSRCAWPAWPGAMREAARWDGKPQRVDFFDVKGDVEALLAPRVADLRALPSIRRCIPAARRACCSTAARSAWSANCIRAGASSGTLPQAPVLFELDLDAVTARDRAAGAAGAQAPGGRARHRRGRGRGGHARRAAAGASTARRPRVCCATRRCSTSTARSRRATRRRRPLARWRRARRAWRCAWASRATARR